MSILQPAASVDIIILFLANRKKALQEGIVGYTALMGNDEQKALELLKVFIEGDLTFNI